MASQFPVRSGGVATLWCKSLDVQILSMSLHHIDVAIRGLGVLEEWWFTSLYRWLDNQHRTLKGELIHDLDNRLRLTSLMGGDFNQIWFNYDMKGGPDKPQHILDLF